MKVTIDITGFFFDREVKVKKGATVEEVMQKAVDDNHKFDAKLFFDKEGANLDGLYVVHTNGSAKSRQDGGRVYPDGVYGFVDDAVTMKDGAFSPAVENISYPGAVVAWQYYIYDASGNDLSRSQSGIVRRIIPFSNSDADFELDDGYTIVWRAVLLQLEPNGVMKMKSKQPALVA